MSTSKTALSSVFVLLIVVTLLSFGQVYQNDFINYDDNRYVTENLRIHDGLTWEGIGWAFTEAEFGGWAPLTWLSFMLDYEFHELNASGYHLTNLTLHVFNVLLLFWVLWRMTGDLWQSSLVAALFGIHPLHVEPVAWVASRKDVLSTLFGLLALWAYVGWVKNQKLSSYLLMVLALVLSLMAKAMFVTFPFLLLLLDYWPLRRLPLRDAKVFGKKVWEKAPLFVLVAAASTVTYLAQEAGGAIKTVPLSVRIGNAMVSYVGYLGKLFWPRDLAVFYPHPAYTSEALGVWPVLGSAALLLGVSAWVAWNARLRPFLLVGWLWYLGTLVPVIGIVQLGVQSMADRYTYVPFIGPFIMLSWGAFDYAASWKHRKVVLASAACFVLLVLMVLTRIQVGYWRDSITLFEHALQVTSKNNRMHNNLGYTLAQQGRSAEAIYHFNRALAIRPDDSSAHFNLGLALDKEGRWQEAVGHFKRSLASRPDVVEVHNSLGIVLAKHGMLEEAQFHFTTALQIKPDFADAHSNLGILLATQGKLEEAIAHFKRALEILPNDASIQENLRIALEMQRNSGNAITE